MTRAALVLETIVTVCAIICIGWFVNPGGLRCPVWMWYLTAFACAFAAIRLVFVWMDHLIGTEPLN